MWPRGMGLEVRWVGDDKQPGDILVICSQNALHAVDMTIVVEARNQGYECSWEDANGLA